MSDSVDRDSELYQWTEQVLKSENVRALNVFTQGSSEKGDGFVADIVFIRATALTSNGKTEEYDLVFKKTKDNEEELGDEKVDLVRRAFEKEIYFYTKILPEFKNFENDKGLPIINFTAKCLGGFNFENKYLLVLENLKKFGYVIYNGKSLDPVHRKLTLESYGHFHAVSFAMKNEKPEQFQKLCGNLRCNTRAYLATTSFQDIIQDLADLISEVLIKNNEEKMLDIFEKKAKNNIALEIIELLDKGEKDEKAIFCHADSWINNFMFQYDVNDKEKKSPSKVAFLDFQLSVRNSPVLDLSYHLYSILGAEDYKSMKQDLEIYYNSLSKKIRDLGGDPAKIFPFSDLVKHWKKYSFAGFMIAMLVLLLTVSEKAETLTMEEMGKDSKNLIINRLKPDVRESYFHRVLCAVRHNLSGEM